jgi:hypothetical protein
MTLTQFFISLGAPLLNSRWSWGCVRDDGIIFLRVWQDETVKHDGRRYMRVTKHAIFADDQENLGYRERLKHLDAIREQARSYMVMCTADPKKLPEREILIYDEDLFEGGAMVEIDGDSWLELGPRVSAKTVRLH